MNFHGSLPLMVLYIISLEPCHGYRIAQIIEEESNNTITVKAGALYPTLRKLEEKGYTQSNKQIENGRTLRFYEITDEGTQALQENLKEWYAYTKSVNLILERKSL